jgi:hypothetical protein
VAVIARCCDRFFAAAAVSRFKFAVLTVGNLRRLRYRRAAMGCCVFNSLIFKFLYEKTAVGEDGGFCVTDKFDNSGIYGKSLLYQP